MGLIHRGSSTQIGDRRPASATNTSHATTEPGSDVQAALWSGRACCCPAKPAVLVIMPPTTGRPQPTELLLCWHHYRASQHSLAVARAMASLADGTPAADAVWPSAIGVETPIM
jgi:hypothetical protein